MYVAGIGKFGDEVKILLDADKIVHRDELKKSAKDLYQRYKKNRNVSIMLYDDLPLQITLIIDNKVITSSMSRGSRSRENLHFLLDIDLQGAKKTFENHFYEVGAGPSKHISTFPWATLAED